MPNDIRDPRPASPWRRTADAREIVAAFLVALRSRDILPPVNLQADGQLHRCDAAGRNGRGDAAYLLHLDGVPAGGFENWRDGLGWQTWRFEQGSPLDPREREALRLRSEAARLQRNSATAQRQAEAALLAVRIWNSARVAPDDHPYLLLKGVQAYGLRIYKGALVVPVRNSAGLLTSLQFIGAAGAKRFLKGGQVAGGHFVVGATTQTVCIAEGYATAASIHAATGHTAVVAFSAGNLGTVSQEIHRQHPSAQLIVCADDDRATPGNPGLTHARAAARAIGARLAAPSLGDGTAEGVTDFNDLHRLHGAEAVCAAVAAASTVEAPAEPTVRRSGRSVPAYSEWPDPEPLTEPLTAHPYPVDALPTRMREAVSQVQAFVQAPAALVAASALAALSLAGQGVVNVRRDDQLVGPVCVYLLSVADSGERKTTCDAMFCRALRDWEVQRRQELVPDIARAEAAAAVFEAKKAGILEAVKLQRRKGEDTARAERELEDLVRDSPEPVTIPRLLYADATPEALAYSLAKGWPSGGVLSAEGGAVFGAHGMSQDTILRNLALLNVLWDGGEMAVDRRSKPSFLLRGRRLTFGLMVQPDALRGFLERAGTLPRGTGFLARFLIAWPTSTQGSRRYRPAPSALPGLESFGRRLCELLAEPLAVDADGCLSPVMLDLAPAALRAWISFHDCVEEELGRHGAFRDIRDVAAKSAENVARLAALFHVLEHGPSGRIDVDTLTAATAVITWHLNESRRLLGELDMPAALGTTIRLDEWLRVEASAAGTHRISTRRIFQYGPKCVRDNQTFKTILATLTERGRARLEMDGRRRYVAVNPALLRGPEATDAAD
jgi:putative DNA primase/helicase